MNFNYEMQRTEKSDAMVMKLVVGNCDAVEYLTQRSVPVSLRYPLTFSYFIVFIRANCNNASDRIQYFGEIFIVKSFKYGLKINWTNPKSSNSYLTCAAIIFLC